MSHYYSPRLNSLISERNGRESRLFGRFTDAIETAQRVLQLATAQDNFALANKLEKDLDLYRTNSPLRDFGLTNAH